MTAMANGNPYRASIFATIARKESVATVKPARHTALRQAAENLSRRNADTAICELFAEGLQRLNVLAYEQYPEGSQNGYVNIDSVTHRLLIPVLWGRSGHRKWSISRGEAAVLREMIQQRQAQTDNRPPGLWLYDRARKNWRLNLFDYDTLADAQSYWQRWPLSVQEYRQARERRSRPRP